MQWILANACSCGNGDLDEAGGVEKIGSSIKNPGPPKLDNASQQEPAVKKDGKTEPCKEETADTSNGQYDYQPLNGDEPEEPLEVQSSDQVVADVVKPPTPKDADAFCEVKDGKFNPLSAMLPSVKELIRQTANKDDIFDLAEHQFCAFGTISPNNKGNATIESEYTEKRLEISGASRSDDFHIALANRGVAISCKKAKKPEMPNQDNIFLCTMGDFTLFGVADGHGPEGHWSSHYVVRYVLRLFMAEIAKTGSPPGDDACIKIFELIHRAVGVQSEDSHQDVTYSGSTLTVCVVDHCKKQVLVAWAGDSRAAIGTVGGANGVALTHDHKPNDDKEQERIESQGGEVSRVDEDSPWRVYMKGKGAPGLAMSRSVGDNCGHSVGVSCVPDIKRFKATNHFVLCCSDGVWEFISDREAVQIVGEAGRQGIKLSLEELTRESYIRWMQEEEDSTDDISAICVYV